MLSLFNTMESNPYSFKKLFILYVCACLPFALLFGICSLMGVSHIKLSGKSYPGAEGFGVIMIGTPIWALTMAGFSWVGLNLGNYLYTIAAVFFLPKNALHMDALRDFLHEHTGDVFISSASTFEADLGFYDQKGKEVIAEFGRRFGVNTSNFYCMPAQMQKLTVAHLLKAMAVRRLDDHIINNN